MQASARASALTDTGVLELAKRIKRKRLILATDPTQASIVPLSSGQGFLRRLGLGKIEVAVGPEITMAKMLREWHALNSFFASAQQTRFGMSTIEEKNTQRVKDTNSRISMVEYRVFGLSPTEKYPLFDSLPEWLAWRTSLAFPEYVANNSCAGWIFELFEFAVQDSEFAFST